MIGLRRMTMRSSTAAFVAIAALLVFGTSTAAAHTELLRSEPIDGGVVADGRTSITLWFSDPISPDASTFDLHTLDGVAVPVTVSIAESDGAGSVEISAAPMARDTYILEWSVLSTEDGHATRGATAFGVGVRPVVASSSGSIVPAAQGVILRWLDLFAFMLAIGALAVSGRVLASIGPGAPVAIRRARRIGALAAIAAVITGALTPLVIMPVADGSIGERLGGISAAMVGTQWGRIWIGREVALIVAAVALWAAIRRPDGARTSIRIAVIALGSGIALEAWAGHASVLPRDVGVAVLASAAHLVSAGIWVGGLIVLAVCLLPSMRRDAAARRSIVGGAWRAFSPIAAIATVVLFATGLYEAGRHIPDPAALTATAYGSAAAAKGILMMAALAIAGLSTLIVNPRLAGRMGHMLRTADRVAATSIEPVRARRGG